MMQMPSSKFGIRHATRSDIAVLVTHRRKMWQDIMRQERGELRINDREYQKWVIELMDRRKFIGIMAVSHSGKIVGSGAIWFREAHPRPWLKKLEEPYLLSMYTEPEFRGKGVATGIVKEAMRRCKKKGYQSIRLHASEMGRRVYSNLGWERSWEMRVKL